MKKEIKNKMETEKVVTVSETEKPKVVKEGKYNFAIKKAVVEAAMAGVDPKNLDISVSNDLLTIRGHRESNKEVEEDNYYSREVYWGTFSRSIVLPQEVSQDKINASLKKGILIITLPKKYKNTSIKIDTVED